MMELVSGAQLLQWANPPLRLRWWHARARAAVRPVMRPFLDLTASDKGVPDFLTPPGAGTDFATELDKVVATPADRVRSDLAPFVESGLLPDRVTPVAHGDPGAMRRLGAAMAAFHAVAVAPYWREIVDAVHADRAARGNTMVERGIEQVLRTVSPVLHWQSGSQPSRPGYECTLMWDCAARIDADVFAPDRGVILVPVYLASVPSILDPVDAPMQLQYPVSIERPEPPVTQPLSKLLGRTRANVLRAVEAGRSTSEVAHHLGISLASASQHTNVLRSAGLIVTHRNGPAVRHSVTPLGARLLASSAKLTAGASAR